MSTGEHLEPEPEKGVDVRDENAEKFEPQGTLEKITKKDGTSFYTRIVSSDDTPSSDWGPEYEMPGEGDAGDVAIRGKDPKPKAFTMPANRDMKEVLKEIMANDGDVRKVPGLKPWRPENDKRNKNQIGWDDDEWGPEEGEEEQGEEEVVDDGTGVMARNQGEATSLSEANHQISMLRIDLQTVKQEKTMKEKSASLKITNLNQKLQENRRVMEDLKISSKREKDSAIDLKRRVDELEEELDSSRKSLVAADLEKKAVETRLVVVQEEVQVGIERSAEKDASILNLSSELERVTKEVADAREESSTINRDWNERWLEHHANQSAIIQKVHEIAVQETEKAKEAEKQKQESDKELLEARKELETSKKDLAEAGASTAAAQIEAAAVAEELEKTKKGWEETKAAFKEDHNLKLLLEEAVGVLREEKQKLLDGNYKDLKALSSANAAVRALEAELKKLSDANYKDLEALSSAKAELAELKERAQQWVLIMTALAAGISLLLLFCLLRSCCCGGGKTTEDDDSDPDAKSSKTHDISEPTSKKSKKKEKKNE